MSDNWEYNQIFSYSCDIHSLGRKSDFFYMSDNWEDAQPLKKWYLDNLFIVNLFFLYWYNYFFYFLFYFCIWFLLHICNSQCKNLDFSHNYGYVHIETFSFFCVELHTISKNGCVCQWISGVSGFINILGGRNPVTLYYNFNRENCQIFSDVYRNY